MMVLAGAFGAALILGVLIGSILWKKYKQAYYDAETALRGRGGGGPTPSPPPEGTYPSEGGAPPPTEEQQSAVVT